MNVAKITKDINIKGDLQINAALAELSSFKVGGSADILARPHSVEDIILLLDWAEAKNIPVTILGGLSNVLISDDGVEGLVIVTTALDRIEMRRGLLFAESGSLISDVSAFAASIGRRGLAFIYSMPGTTGGAIWMNARCYGSEIADVLEAVDYIDVKSRKLVNILANSKDFSYKYSPFQQGGKIILSAYFKLGKYQKQAGNSLWKEMNNYKADRRAKGHFSAPCAGSIFKNNREFGEPSGAIIDRLGLKGTQIGSAKVSENHANIIVNSGNARACEISELMDFIHQQVKEKTGFDLEAEVIKVGRW